ncbi:MAG TPA: TauD/TfdA family dioxygenase, partial [Pseudomonadales bacterium]|nr:TauD/TfdA family dioxygenase [Pseudomonadales bacterium]
MQIALPQPQRPFVLAEADGGTPVLEAIADATLRELFMAHGALLLRGFPFSLTAFGALAARHCARFVNNESRGREQVSEDGRIQTVNLGRGHFPLHPELARVPWQPDILWFACERPAELGGETTICDGIAAARAFRPALRAHLEGSVLRHTEPVTEAWCRDFLGLETLTPMALAAAGAPFAFEFEMVAGRLMRSYLRPMLHRPLYDDSPAYGNFLVFSRQALGNRTYPTYADGSAIEDGLVEEIAAVTNRLATPIAWQAGDILMLDNTRFMHGRNPIGDPQHRRIYTQFGYSAFLP